MASVNKVILIGNLTRDPEIRYTPKGTAVGDIAIAVNRVRTGDDGNRIEEVTYVDVTLWGRQAEVAGQYLAKGRSVYIEGRLQLDTWDDKATGQKRSRLRVVGENMQFLGGQGQSGGGGNQGGGGGAPQQQPQSSPPEQSQSTPPPQQQAPAQGGAAASGNFDDDADDIPF
ncbi:single-stranded DNA-binding protein [Akkermansiaceae bacterium]|nr:single-stranded DNA-binding protein [bacterium]MDC1350259.1 single-stranded DNA-binding protein [Akkermansiaceae bacterium]